MGSKVLTVLGLCLYLMACGYNPPQSQSRALRDSGPDRDIDVSTIPDAVPRADPITAAGNKSPYTVLGKTYRINFNTAGFQQEGYASWYGKKFHGRRTSNGEVYDMFAMTAAHKTLPIPSYVRVTNVENGRQVTVRVNDRGPFHGDRIIDLSYSAAKKLGFHDQGTAKVRIAIIDPLNSPARPQSPAAAQPEPTVAGEPNTYLQVGAFSQKRSAENLHNKVTALTEYDIRIHSAPELYKVLIGPIVDNFDLMILRKVLLDNNLPEPHVVEL